MKGSLPASDLILDVFDGFRAAPGRLAVMVMALFLGTSSLVLLLAAVGGLKDQAQRMEEDFGVHVFAVSADPQLRSGAVLRSAHVEMLREGLPGRTISGVSRREAPFGHDGRPVSVWQIDDKLAEVRQWGLAEGRFFEAEDLALMTRYAVVTHGLATRWNLRPGTTLQLRRTPYEVIGVLAPGAGFGVDDDTSMASPLSDELGIFLPWTTPAYWSTDARRWDRVDTIYVQSEDAKGLAADMLLSRGLLELDPSLVGALSWISPEQLLERVRRLQRVIVWTLGSVTGLCLVLGGTILMSVMIGNVRDRVPEIGLRRAMGATGKDISRMFVVEAGVLTSFSGVLAVILVHGVLGVVRSHLPMPVAFGGMTWLVPVGIAMIVGVVFAYAPARMAASIAPAEALRNE